ncbi:MAG: hypothetical protein K0R60_47 [Microbacterium sp.]|jgi:hypothetical protein|nr:hypothetical protein [Microbacterium sp.]
MITAAQETAWMDRLWAMAEQIREWAPIAGQTATDAEAVERGLMISDWLSEHDIDTCVHDRMGNRISGRHIWHSVLFEDGSTGGLWADNPDETALTCMVWHGKRARIVVEDPQCVALNAWRAANGQTVKVAASGEVVPSGGLLDLLDETYEKGQD